MGGGGAEKELGMECQVRSRSMMGPADEIHDLVAVQNCSNVLSLSIYFIIMGGRTGGRNERPD